MRISPQLTAYCAALLIALVTGAPLVAKSEPAASANARWGLYEEAAGRTIIVARWPNDPSRSALFDSATGAFTPLSETPGALCTADCKVRLTWSGGDPAKANLTVTRNGVTQSAKRSPIDISNLNFESDGLRFVGRVWSPRSAGRHPAVVLIGGSGKNLRDDFRIYPYIFARAGYVVYAFDKRGSGESGGDPSVSEEGVRPLAADTLAAVQRVRGQGDVDPSRVGLLGISHGAWVAVEAAREDSHVAFIVPIVGGGVPLWRATLYQVANELVDKGHSAAEVDEGRALMQQAFDDLAADHADAVPALITSAAGKPWFKDTPFAPFAGLPASVVVPIAKARWAGELSYDPATDLRSLRIPILAIAGENDRTVPGPENLAAIVAASNGRARALLLKGANHYQSLIGGPGMVYAPELLPVLEAWLADLRR